MFNSVNKKWNHLWRDHIEEHKLFLLLADEKALRDCITKSEVNYYDSNKKMFKADAEDGYVLVTKRENSFSLIHFKETYSSFIFDEKEKNDRGWYNFFSTFEEKASKITMY